MNTAKTVVNAFTDATDKPETPDMPMLLQKSYLGNRNDIRTPDPHVASADFESILEMFGFSQTLALTGDKTISRARQGHKVMITSVTYDGIDPVRILSLRGTSTEIHAVFKKPDGFDQFHLDALQINESHQLTNIHCGESTIEKERLADFIACFKETAISLATDAEVKDRDGRNIDLEQWLNQNLLLAFQKLNFVQMWDEICVFPASQPK